jgi:hypothetical protein
MPTSKQTAELKAKPQEPTSCDLEIFSLQQSKTVKQDACEHYMQFVLWFGMTCSATVFICSSSAGTRQHYFDKGTVISTVGLSLQSS